ncbi:MAG: EAL domain-containing protein [Candidatus Eremiobacteraeota bacterium]|nr:EAL domain-containing protein [Candidatus Eremiobacteraeota bacterium]
MADSADHGAPNAAATGRRKVSEKVRRRGTNAAADYRPIFACHPQPMWIFDLATLRFLDVNEAACRAYGYGRRRFLAMTLGDIRPHEDDERLSDHLDGLRRTDVPTTAQTLWRHRRADGSIFYADVMSNGIVFRAKDARIVLAIDATARLAVSRALTESRAALAEAQELAHLGSFETDFESGDMRWSSELYRILGVDPARERPSMLYAFDHPDDAVAVGREIERGRREGGPYTIEHRILTRDGRQRYVYERGQFLPQGDEPRRVVGAILDITERKQAEERLRFLAHHDVLTGLPNRTLLGERLAATVARAATEGAPIVVLFIDIDRFKSINDTIAHAAGDHVLRELAARLAGTVRDDAMVARPGGDEFAVVFEGSEDDALALADRLRTTLAEPIAYYDATLRVSGSIGLALYPRDGAAPAELLRSADAAMYAAKARGGNAIAVYAPELHTRALHEVQLERTLRLAIEDETIGIIYQPIVDAQSGLPVGCEALLRFETDGRAISPAEFVPLAETTGLIVPLGALVLARACSEAKRLVLSGHDALTMCVNVSAHQLRDADFLGTVRQALATAALAPHHLQLEITESAYVGSAAVVENLTALHALGVRLSIDDFGTGYSSLGYLKRLPVDTLKVDRSFVADILADTADQAIVRAIIAVAQNLGLCTVAEGVETLEQATWLGQIGCQRLQGYYFSRPLAAEALHAYFDQPPSSERGAWTA